MLVLVAVGGNVGGMGSGVGCCAGSWAGVATTAPNGVGVHVDGRPDAPGRCACRTR
ncbi:MAG: hypothetical protein R2854_25320 [Caldilineaceae bacterium]